MSTQAERGSASDRAYLQFDWRTIKSVFQKPGVRAVLERAAASSPNPIVTPDDAIASIVAAMVDNPKLGECHELSFVYCAMMSIRTGLPIGKPLDNVYLVPRWNKPIGSMFCYYTIGYIGWCSVAYRSGKVAAIQGVAVRDKDEYEVWQGTRKEIHHKLGNPRGDKIIGSYAVAWLHGSPVPLIATLDRDELEKRRAMSKGDVWDKWPDSMSAGKAVRALSPFLPRTPEMGFCLMAENRYENPDADDVLVRELGEEIGENLLPASTAVAVNVETRVAERARELVPVAAGTGTEGETPPLFAAVEPPSGGAPERLHITEDEVRALMMSAQNVHGPKHVETWVEEAFARYGVDSLLYLSPSQKRDEEERLARALRSQMTT